MNESNIKLNSKIKMNNNDKIENMENIKNYIDEEINGLSYSMAVQYDKRNFWQYYVSLLKTQYNLICAIFNKNDYNSGMVKINLFIIGFVIEYSVNSLFYNDEEIHNIYESKGKFDFETQLPIMIYSTLISTLLNSLLNFFALSNDAIISFKHDFSKINVKEKAKSLTNKITIKFILYFVISFIFLVFFWYYISIFCVIYKNTQIHLIKETLVSFLLKLYLIVILKENVYIILVNFYLNYFIY